MRQLSARLGHGYSANGDFLALGLKPSKPFGATHGPTITTAYVHDREQDGRRIRLTVEDGGYSSRLARLLPFTHPGRIAHVAGHKLRNQHHPIEALLQEEGDTSVVLLVTATTARTGRSSWRGPIIASACAGDTPSNLHLYAAETAVCRELITELGGRLFKQERRASQTRSGGRLRLVRCGGDFGAISQ